MSKKKASEPMPEAKTAGERDYETEGHLRTLMDAQSIQSDPEKMKKVQAHAAKQAKAITSIQGIKNAYSATVKAKKKQVMGDGSNDGT